MRVAVFGLGYVGSVSAAFFAARGHTVLGVDPDPLKTEALMDGRAPQAEPGLTELVREGVAAGRLGIAPTAAEAVAGTELALLCVGTPSLPSGELDTRALQQVAGEIGAALPADGEPYGVVVRSTSLPGTSRRVADWIAGAGGPLASGRFGVAVNPEFLREGTAIEDFERPPFTVVGSDDAWLIAMLRELYAVVEGPFHATSTGVAEALKYACNSFHATKVVFANEIGRICRAAGVDGREVMRIFCDDHDLNLSAYYLKPGFSYGGSCLPKDVRALVNAARHLDVEVPLLSSLETSNRLPVEDALGRVLARGKPRTAMIGMSFKADTDDMRESPFLELVERLIGKGLDVAVLDPDVRWQDVFGSNRAFVTRELPHVSRVLVDDFAGLGDREFVVVGKAVPGLHEYLGSLGPECLVLDLVDVVGDPGSLAAEVQGIAW